MSSSQQRSRRLAVQPEADTDTVENLVRKVQSGQVRIPSFQRDLKWKAKDVRDLYDSIYVGYPVGALLLRKAPAKAEKLKLGPLEVQAPETQTALWVVDGQQRLVSLAAALARPTPIPTTPADPYVLYFDPVARAFESPPASGDVPDTWVPVAELVDATRLSEWVFNWQHAQDSALRKAVFDAGTRIRQYSIPLYTVETDDMTILKEIFLRINKKGKDLEWKEVYDAMFGHSGTEPSTLADLSERLVDVGMGAVPEDLLLSCVIASRGLDVTQTVSVHYDRDPSLLSDAVPAALPALRAALGFLKTSAEIPHIRLLPVSLPVPVLTRFFALFPDPNARVRTLLARWTWRVLVDDTDMNRLTLLRRGVAAVEAPDAETAVQALLGFTRQEPYRAAFEWPERFDARSATSRLILLGMSSLRPLDLETARPLDVASVIESHGGSARRILSVSRRMDEHDRRSLSSPANRVLLPGTGVAWRDLLEVQQRLLSSANGTAARAVLSSHGIPESASHTLAARDAEALVAVRSDIVDQATRDLIERLTGWDHSDRPSIDHLLAADG